MPEHQSAGSRRGVFTWIGQVYRLIQFLTRAIIVLIGGWIAFSRLFISRKVDLPHAVGGERRTFSMNGLELSYYVSGAGKPLVLIHSINAAASAYEMRPLYEHFAASHRVYALDLPGFGFSVRHDLDYSPQLYANAIQAFLKTQVVEAAGPADVVALSLGGEFAARAAAEAPELFTSLTLISPTGFGGNRGVVVRRGKRTGSPRMMNILRWPVWSQALYDLLTSRPSLRFFLKMAFAGPVDEKLLAYAYQTAHQPGAHHAPFYFISGKLFSPDIWPIYNDLQLPVLVLYNKDAFTRFDRLAELAERPNWTAVRIKGAGSLPHFVKPEETSAILTAFLEDYYLPG